MTIPFDDLATGKPATALGLLVSELTDNAASPLGIVRTTIRAR